MRSKEGKSAAGQSKIERIKPIEHSMTHHRIIARGMESRHLGTVGTIRERKKTGNRSGCTATSRATLALVQDAGIIARRTGPRENPRGHWVIISHGRQLLNGPRDITMAALKRSSSFETHRRFVSTKSSKRMRASFQNSLSTS